MLDARCWIALIMLATALAACGGSSATSTPTGRALTSNATPPPIATAVETISGATTPASPTLTPTTQSRPATATIVSHGNASRRMVALTFDAGSDVGYTGEILDVLHREGVRATFSVTGLWAERNRDLLLAIAAAGHQIINHTYDHASFTGVSTNTAPLTRDQRALELSRTEVTVYHLSGRSTRPYFRPPYGDVDASVQRDAAAAGYSTIVMWSIDTLGWNHATADAIVERSLARAEPGAIYVMHVGSESQDAAALPRIIDGLRVQGYTFGALDDVLAP